MHTHAAWSRRLDEVSRLIDEGLVTCDTGGLTGIHVVDSLAQVMLVCDGIKSVSWCSGHPPVAPTNEIVATNNYWPATADNVRAKTGEYLRVLAPGGGIHR